MRKGKVEQWEKEIIATMRNENKSYTEIAKQLNCKKDRVKNYCGRNQLGGARAARINQWGNPSEMEESFRIQFQKINPKFKYHSNYTGANNFFNSECRVCGYIQERTAQAGRPSSKDIEIKCNQCIEIDRNRKEIIKLLGRVLSDKQKQIDKVVSVEVRNLRRIAKKHRHYLECEECGKEYFSDRKRITCSTECSNKRNNRIKEIKRREKILKNGEVHWDISIDRLIKRDGDKCYLCHEKINFDDYYINNSGIHIAGGKYPSIDHVIPISKGGTHTWDNVKIAHRHCNTIKRDDADVGLSSNGQMIMII